MIKYILLLPVFCESGQSQLITNGVANAASFEPGLPVGASLAAVCTYGFTGPAGITYAASSSPVAGRTGWRPGYGQRAPAPILAVEVTG